MIQDNNKIQDDSQSLQMAVKSRFFAQYWGTKTLYIEGKGLVEIGQGGWNLKHPDFFLQLKSIADLSKMHSLQVSQIMGANHNVTDPLRYTSISNENSIKTIDFLRSKGYAIPFMEYSVDDLVSFGWVQLL